MSWSISLFLLLVVASAPAAPYAPNAPNAPSTGVVHHGTGTCFNSVMILRGGGAPAERATGSNGSEAGRDGVGDVEAGVSRLSLRQEVNKGGLSEGPNSALASRGATGVDSSSLWGGPSAELPSGGLGSMERWPGESDDGDGFGDPDAPRCWNCKVRDSVQACAMCETATYCGTKCTLDHWRRHRDSCRLLRPKSRTDGPFPPRANWYNVTMGYGRGEPAAVRVIDQVSPWAIEWASPRESAALRGSGDPNDSSTQKGLKEQRLRRKDILGLARGGRGGARARGGWRGQGGPGGAPFREQAGRSPSPASPGGRGGGGRGG
jgi:hypothetical protein